MDYSSSINNSEDPAGASPWGSSPVASPRHARTGSYSASSDVPSSPTPFSSNASQQASYSQSDTIGGSLYNRPTSSAGTESAAESEDHRPDTADSVGIEPEQALAGHHQQQQAAAGVQPQRSEPQRYHPGARGSHQQQASQYKLQAKITGLERTGRKDPILRFDVHVC
jgi:hypothetical protein